MFYHHSFQQAKGEEAKEAKEAKDGAAKTGEGHGEVPPRACFILFHRCLRRAMDFYRCRQEDQETGYL